MTIELILRELAERYGFDIDTVPVISEYHRLRTLGAARAISVIVNDHENVVGVKTHSGIRGGAEGDDELHIHSWVIVYRTKRCISDKEE